MATTTQATALIGVFPDHRQADRFVAELKKAGFRDEQLGVMTPNPEQADSPVEDSALAGALTGGTLGALTGAALTIGLVPGVGPIVAGGGLLLGLLGGAAAGATAGGVLGALIGLGVPEEQARHYEAQIHAGRTLVVVEPETRFADALAILRRIEAEESPAAKPKAEFLEHRSTVP
jgi:hypothetical protein